MPLEKNYPQPDECNAKSSGTMAVSKESEIDAVISKFVRLLDASTYIADDMMAITNRLGGSIPENAIEPKPMPHREGKIGELENIYYQIANRFEVIDRERTRLNDLV